MAKSKSQKKLERKQRKAKIRALQYAASALRKQQKGFKVAVKHPTREVYSHKKADAKRIKRQYAADDRQAKYEMLSKAEKLNRIKNRRGESKKELARVLASK